MVEMERGWWGAANIWEQMGTEWIGLENSLCGGSRAWEKGGEAKERPRGEEQAPRGSEAVLDAQSSVDS